MHAFYFPPQILSYKATSKFLRSRHDMIKLHSFFSFLSLTSCCLLWPLNYAWIPRQFVDKRRFFKRNISAAFHSPSAMCQFCTDISSQRSVQMNAVFPLIEYVISFRQLPLDILLIRDRRYNLIGSNNIENRNLKTRSQNWWNIFFLLPTQALFSQHKLLNSIKKLKFSNLEQSCKDTEKWLEWMNEFNVW